MSTARRSIRALRATDLPAALALWGHSEGIALTESDNLDSLRAFLRRNPGLSSAAFLGGRLVGAVLCGHDGWRGFLYHLAVAREQRRQGIARQLIHRSLDRLRGTGVRRCSIHLLADNASGMAFWRQAGWTPRADVMFMQRPI